ncbi:hypothetical protein [Streptomyces sp. NPDC002521]
MHLSRAGVVVLDEATCYLDPAAEARAEHAFAARGGTLIVVAHRITSAQRARWIMLFTNTGPVTGTHAHLLQTSPIYADNMVGHWRERPPEVTTGTPVQTSSREKRAMHDAKVTTAGH